MNEEDTQRIIAELQQEVSILRTLKTVPGAPLTFEELVNQRDVLHRMFHEMKIQRDSFMRAISRSEKIRIKLNERMAKMSRREREFQRVLQFYAKESHYYRNQTSGMCDVQCDFGAIARNALG